MDGTSQETAITDLVLAFGQLVRRLRAAGATQELSLTQVSVMSRLDREGPATTADLARAEGMKPQSMGAAIAELEKMDLVGRTPHPTDGRQALIALTATGADLRKSVRKAKLTWLAHAIAQLNPGEQETLFAAGEIIKRLVES